MISYSENYLVLLLWEYRGSVFPRAIIWAVPPALLAFFLALADQTFWPTVRQDLAMNQTANNSQLWLASTGVLSALLAFRCHRAMSRFWEATGLLHQMRGEWFDSVSCCVAFSGSSLKAKRKETLQFRHTLARLMSLCHGSALKEIGDSETDEVETIDMEGLDNETIAHLVLCKMEGFNRVEVLLHMIQSLIHHNMHLGVLSVPPPVLSRVYQTLSRGFVNLLNAKKIADTRFPFPFVQTITTLLICNCVIVPVVTTSHMKHPGMCAFLTFVPIFGMGALNFIGVELENPFGSDANDLPLDYFQYKMNNCLLVLLHDVADHVPTVVLERCITDLDEFRERMVSDTSTEGVFANWDQEAVDAEIAEREAAAVKAEEARQEAEKKAAAEKAVEPAAKAAAMKMPNPTLVTMEKVIASLTEIRDAVQTQGQAVKVCAALIDEVTIEATEETPGLSDPLRKEFISGPDPAVHPPSKSIWDGFCKP
mmetsp:Transcript_91744/g.163283  ORF Transcript_91744/g.163283 Transcript_91744/m.163283 type:complete len:481 (+) Transcript_91744:59-1501(+)